MKHFLKGFLEGKSLAPKWRKSADKSLSQPSCSHCNTICEVQLQKTIVLRMQPKEEATLAIPFTLREPSYSCKSQWNSIGNSSSSITCNPIYIAGTILKLQITMQFHQQLVHQQHLQPHLQCGNDPTVANHNGIPSTTHPAAPLAIPFTLRERSYSCKSQWNSIDNSSSSTTCNPIYIAGTILQLQITMEFCRPHMHEKQLTPHLQCGTDRE